MTRDALQGEASPHGLGLEDFQFGADEPPTSKGDRNRSSRPSFEAEASIVVRRPEDVLLAKTAAEMLCMNLIGSTRQLALVGHAVSELGQNILKHAGDGTIALASIRGPRMGLEIFAHDSGPGIAHVQPLLLPRRVWGFTPEPGLRGIRRIAHEFDIDTSPRGTHVRVVMYR